MLILRDGDLAELLSADTARDALTTTLHEQAAGAVDIPARLTVEAPGDAWLRVMPVLNAKAGMMGFKAMNVTPGFGVRSFMALIDVHDGNVVALLDADVITTLRTAATVAIATDLFAPAEIEHMALLGSGVTAEAVVRSVARIRRLVRVSIYSPTAGHREDLAARLSHSLGIDARAVASARAAVRPADLICGAYRASDTPAIEAADLRTHVHINSLSSVREQAREVAADVWRTCTCVFLDHRAGVAQSGDGLAVLRSHPFDLERAPELWEIVRDAKCRATDDGRTMFKSVGFAAQDLALAMLGYRLAKAAGVGEVLRDFPAVRHRR